MPYKRPNYCRERLVDPKKFDPRSFRTIASGKVKIIIGCPKSHWDSRKKKCKVGTRAQAILRPIARGVCPKGVYHIKAQPKRKKQKWVF